jgi:hypothetical protein
MQKRPSPGLCIARNSFDPDELFKLYKDYALRLNDAARQDMVDGLTFIATPQGVLPREHVPGAGRAAESSAGAVGLFMRMVHRRGYDSKSPAVIEALEQQKLEAHRRGFQAHLRKIRKNKEAYAREEYERLRAIEDGRFRRSVTLGNAIIDQAIRCSPDMNDYPVEWPVAWVGQRDGKALPIPVSDPHERAGAAWGQLDAAAEPVEEPDFSDEDAAEMGTPK